LVWTIDKNNINVVLYNYTLHKCKRIVFLGMLSILNNLNMLGGNFQLQTNRWSEDYGEAGIRVPDCREIGAKGRKREVSYF